MSRPIKFRAWDDELKTMFYSKQEQFDDSLLFRFNHFDTDEPIYMQYTGLKDKNGREIYEGDIVRYISSGERVNYLVVKWSTIDAAFLFGWVRTDFASNNGEVIGNVFEDHSLLEVKE